MLGLFRLTARFLFVLLASSLPLLATASLAETPEEMRGQAFSLFYGSADDKARAIDLFESAAAGGDSVSMVFLGGIYETGDGVPANRQTAIDWYVKAIAAGNQDAATKLAKLAAAAPAASTTSTEPVPAAPAPEPEEPEIDTEELLNNAVAAFDFDSTDNAEAIRLFEEAANAGDAKAADWLTSIYYFPMGVPKEDYKKARKWALQAAEGGIATAMIPLAVMYGNGLGGKRDYAAYIEWLEKAADLGQRGAYFHLGNAYFNGEAAKRDLVKAFDYQLKAAELDIPDANALIAFRYLHGEGTKRNAIKSAEHLFRAIQLGSEYAMENLRSYAADRLVMSHFQELLQSNGYYDGAVDGSLGPQTRAAVELAFNTANT